MLHREDLPYLSEIIRTKLISCHHDDPLAGHFGIAKTWKFVVRNYYWPRLQANIEFYVKESDVYLIAKALRHEPYVDLQSLLVLTY